MCTQSEIWDKDTYLGVFMAAESRASQGAWLQADSELMGKLDIWQE